MPATNNNQPIRDSHRFFVTALSICSFIPAIRCTAPPSTGEPKKAAWARSRIAVTLAPISWPAAISTAPIPISINPHTSIAQFSNSLEHQHHQKTTSTLRALTPKSAQQFIESWLEDHARVFQGLTMLSGSSTKMASISYRLCSYTGRSD